jgi:hypothetical protein
MWTAKTAAQMRGRPQKPDRLSPEPVQQEFHRLPHIVTTQSGDATVLMDLKRGTYHTLNEVGGRVWQLLDGGSTIPALIERLLEEYDVPQQQLETDVTAMLRQFLADHLIAPGLSIALDPSPIHRGKTVRQVGTLSDVLRVPSVFWCGLMLLVLKMQLKFRGYSRTIDWIRRNVENVPLRGEVEFDLVKATEYKVAMAGALYPGRARCLEQSLTLYYLLRRDGVPVKYRQGVQPYPFQAHAWVDYRDEVINDVPEHARFFAQLPEQLP